MGNNPCSISDSVCLLKDVEMRRARPGPSSTEGLVNSEILSDEEDNEFENITLGHLGSNLLEEILEDDNDHLSCDFRTIFKRNKALSLTISNRKPKVRVLKKHKQVLR